MELSYWELKSWFSNVDFTIVGCGIVGLNTALRLRESYPKSKILILERGSLPLGASTKNAGFACFGSLSEVIDNLNDHTEEQVVNLIQKRWLGLKILRETLGDHQIDFRAHGGYELFLNNDETTFQECLNKLPIINKILKPLFKSEVFIKKDDDFGFRNIKKEVLFNPFEAQIDTGKMMHQLLKLAVAKNILILNNQNVTAFNQNNNNVTVSLSEFEYKTGKLLFATNGFANELFPADVTPARAQVLITKPIIGLSIKGTFHLDKGYYYFRNIDDRIMLGGGRNLNFQGESTNQFGQTDQIQNHLEKMLREVILPTTKFEVDHRWSGIMGMGPEKNPIVKQLSENVFCGVRLGGMGVAIGSLIGRELADLTI